MCQINDTLSSYLHYQPHHLTHRYLKSRLRMDKKTEHLKLLQGVINRMARNSFLLKSWSVVIVSALFALSGKEDTALFAYIGFFPAISFWILDGYFLWQERLFRKLYDRVRVLEESNINFSMDTSVVSDQVDSWLRTTFSTTLIIFHGIVVIAIISVLFVLIAYI